MPDHDTLFKQLKDKICANVTPYVVQLQSNACNAGLCVYIALYTCACVHQEILQQE